ncbi:MAG: hypothetical protein HZA78_08075 [Candidatus Schekmanbacteria bacterium]|nr:hypothetical protein [Candidatus Schekmanbacteria bacterium]
MKKTNNRRRNNRIRRKEGLVNNLKDMPEPPVSFKKRIFAELGLDDNDKEMIIHNRRAEDAVDYTRLTRLIEHNNPLLIHICRHTGLKKEDVIGAAVLLFSTLPLEKQLEIAADYRKECLPHVYST